MSANEGKWAWKDTLGWRWADSMRVGAHLPCDIAMHVPDFDGL
jgi:hypothetical protein